MRYIKCGGCGCKIPFGEIVWGFYESEKCGGLYCSPDCFASANSMDFELDENTAEMYQETVHDDEAIRAEIRSLERSIESTVERIARLKQELDN